MKEALRIASLRAVRTFAQTAAGGVLGLGALGSLTDIKVYGGGIALVLISAAMAALVAFLQNVAEAIPE